MTLNNPRGIKRKVAAGSYAGNDTDGRQIVTGWKCAFVSVVELTGSRRVTMVPNASIFDRATAHNTDCTARQYIHATNGFVVGVTTEGMNSPGGTYYYFAVEAD